MVGTDNSWNGMSFEGRDAMLAVVRREGDQFLDLASHPGAWTAPTGAGPWRVRDLVGHIADTTEAYFESFDAARSNSEMPAAYGLPGMAERVDSQARALR